MAGLHKKYLKKDGPTDVLAFPQQSSDERDQGFIFPKDRRLELGDIVICYPLAVDKAVNLGILVDESICQLAIHGLKNLIGEGE